MILNLATVAVEAAIGARNARDMSRACKDKSFNENFKIINNFFDRIWNERGGGSFRDRGSGKH